MEPTGSHEHRTCRPELNPIPTAHNLATGVSDHQRSPYLPSFLTSPGQHLRLGVPRAWTSPAVFTKPKAGDPGTAHHVSVRSTAPGPPPERRLGCAPAEPLEGHHP